MRIGVDTGGTFTDFVTIEGGRIKVFKVFSPSDVTSTILDGVRRLHLESPSLRRRKLGTSPVALEIIHGTTVGTNSLLERRGARVALVTTAGFEDLIEIGRQARPQLYNLNVQREPPLVARPLRFGVDERTASDGTILRRPTAAGLRQLRARIRRSGARSIAVCFLFSFANPTNERVVHRALRSLNLPVSVSHEILPEFREYERLSTVVINAYLGPRLGNYLGQLEQSMGELLGSPSNSFPPRSPGLRARNKGRRLFVMQSSGGITTAGRAAKEPVRTILSGPAGGVVATAWLAERLGVRQTISFDMGGTSTDVCLLDGPPRTTNETTLGGLAVAVPMLDIHSVGAGGGSLVRFDRGGALRVGPESAGAFPGPICYAQGGAAPTVTDANLVLGRLDPHHFLGGEFRLDAQAAERGLAEFVRQAPRGAGFRNPFELAQGIVAVSNAAMEMALRVISVERGYDPRDFSLVSFGGAGGLHAAELTRALGLARVIVPANPGAFSALGILVSDVVKDLSKSVLLPVPAKTTPQGAVEFRAFLRDLERKFRKLERAGHSELRNEHFLSEQVRAARRLSVRYVGQSYDLSVPFSPRLTEQFHLEHEKAYGHAQPDRPVEIVSLRVRLVIRRRKPEGVPAAYLRLKAGATRRRASPPVPLNRKRVWFEARLWPTPFYDRERLGPRSHFPGPAVVVEYSSTTVVPPGFHCHVDDFGNLVVMQA